MQKAKKAKDKLLKREGDERTDNSYESFYYGGVDPYMWEPQELGEVLTTEDKFTKKKKINLIKFSVQSKTSCSCIIRCLQSDSCHCQTVISFLL